ncbi:MAG: flippase [Dehalococcoidia bacterium]|nr:flippase [Dehalococcoidia bacterium]
MPPTVPEATDARDRSAEFRPKAPDRYLRIAAKGAGVTFAGRWIGHLATLLSALVVARFLGAEAYGLYILGIMVITTLSALANFGLPKAAQRYIAIFRGEGNAESTKGVVVTSLAIVGIAGSLMALLLFLFSAFIGETVFGKPELGPVFRDLAAAIPLLSLASVAVLSTFTFGTAKYGVLIEHLLKPWVGLAASIILFWLGWRLEGALAAYLIAMALGCGLALYYLNRLFPLARTGIRAVYQPGLLVSFGLPVLGSDLLWLLQSQADVYLLGFLGTPKDVGIYRASVMLALLVSEALISFSNIFSPMVSELHHSGQLEELKRLYQSLTRWSLAASLPFALGLTLYAGCILPVFGPAFASGGPSLALLSVGQLINAATGPGGPMILMTGRPRLNLANDAAALAITAALCLLLIPRLGMLGAAVAAAAATTLVNLLRALEVRVLLGMSPASNGIWKPLAAGLAAGAASWVLSTHLLPPVGPGALAVNLFFLLGAYALAMWLLGFEREDLVMAAAMKRRLASAMSPVR